MCRQGLVDGIYVKIRRGSIKELRPGATWYHVRAYVKMSKCNCQSTRVADSGHCVHGAVGVGPSPYHNRRCEDSGTWNFLQRFPVYLKFCACVWVCARECRCPWRHGEGIGSPRTGVTSGWELPRMGARNQTLG